MRLGGFSHHFSSYIAQEPVSYRPNYRKVGNAHGLFFSGSQDMEPETTDVQDQDAKKAFYKERIEPLAEQIHALCEEAKIPYLFLAETDNSVVGGVFADSDNGARPKVLGIFLGLAEALGVA